MALSIGSGVVGGIFFAFSNFIMQALARLPDSAGAAAMRQINETVLNPLFFAVFLGTGAGALVAGVLALRSWGDRGTGVALAGAAAYLIGSVGVTVAFNVPLNERLAKAEPGGVERSRVWTHYLRLWTRWNHVRTVGSLVAAALFGSAAM